jgi:hypothetical protein
MKRNNRIDSSHMRDFSRREFIQVSAGAAALSMLGRPKSVGAQPGEGWNQGQLAHLIPTASHERFLIKASFKAPHTGTPRLFVNGKSIEGVQTDPQGRFWRFDAPSLQPATPYELRLTDPSGAPLCDAWPLKIFPAPDTPPDRLRILAFTCAGGYDSPPLEGKTFFLDMAARRRLLARGMSYRPDVVIANGDHLYWDIETSLNKPFAKFIQDEMWAKFGGALDLTVPMLHAKNASIFTGICDYQIAGLYGNTLRSTPAYFVTDDHDMFENDEFDNRVAALPLAYSSGKLGDWYPDLLDDETGRLVLYREKAGWQRGWLAQHQRLIEALKPTEKNGFTVIDVTPDKMTFTMFMWRPLQSVALIDTMQPALVYEVPRKA